MLLIVPALLIAKAATLLPMGEWQFTPEDLASYLASVDTAILQSEGDTTVRMLVTVHTALVLAQAAISKFVNNTITVAGFGKEEVGEEDTQGNFQPGAIQRNADEIAKAEGASGTNLSRRLLEDTADQLQQYIEKPADLPAGFQVASCLATCRQAAKHAEDVNNRCLLTALAVIQSLLDEVDLDQVRAWAGDPHIAGNTSNWLADQLDADTLGQQVKDCFKPDSPCPDDAKMALQRVVKMLQNNDSFFNSVKERLDKLEETIHQFPPTLADEQAAWFNLVRAMHGAVAWQIFQQAQLAAREARTALSRSP